MKYVLVLSFLFCASISSADVYESCSNESETLKYNPGSLKLTYNDEKVYDWSEYTILFKGLTSVDTGSCVAEDGQSYDYSVVKYDVVVNFTRVSAGLVILNCEQVKDELPANLNCVE